MNEDLRLVVLEMGRIFDSIVVKPGEMSIKVKDLERLVELNKQLARFEELGLN